MVWLYENQKKFLGLIGVSHDDGFLLNKLANVLITHAIGRYKI